jgi:hypothetical protein
LGHHGIHVHPHFTTLIGKKIATNLNIYKKYFFHI